MEDHAHVYRIESPGGPTSRGVCEGCGQKREDFANYVELAHSWMHKGDTHSDASALESVRKDIME
jgi:hypothetical protein